MSQGFRTAGCQHSMQHVPIQMLSWMVFLKTLLNAIGMIQHMMKQQAVLLHHCQRCYGVCTAVLCSVGTARSMWASSSRAMVEERTFSSAIVLLNNADSAAAFIDSRRDGSQVVWTFCTASGLRSDCKIQWIISSINTSSKAAEKLTD